MPGGRDFYFFKDQYVWFYPKSLDYLICGSRLLKQCRGVRYEFHLMG